MERETTTAQVAAQILGKDAATVVDVGARWGASEAWWRLPPLAKLVGFEPDIAECDRLNAHSAESEKFVPVALGRQAGRVPFYRAAEPGCSSVLKPLSALESRFSALKVLRVEGSSTIEMTCLDEVPEVREGVSFIKLDTQGSELDILRAGERVLKNCLGIEVEVQFLQMYDGAPHFVEVDLYLRQKGYVLWRLSELCHYTHRPTASLSGAEATFFGDASTTQSIGSGRLAWGNAIYFRDFLDPSLVGDSPQALLILASLLDARGDVDAASGCLSQMLHCHRSILSKVDCAAIAQRIEELNQAR